MGTEKIQLIYGLQSCLKCPNITTHKSTHAHQSTNTHCISLSFVCRISKKLVYLSHPYGAAIELRDPLVGLITSLPHPIILQRD